MTAADITVPFVFGLVSSLHCTQMCGPIVLSYSLAGRDTASSHLLYNLGRMLTYSALGAVAGLLGNAMGLFGQLAGVEKPAMIVAGCLMLVAGVFMSGIVPRSSLVRIERVGVSRLFSKTITQLMTSSSSTSRFGLGVLMGFLPCGLLYAALFKAVSTGEALGGAVTMASFAAGTALALLAIGIFSTAIGARLGRWTSTFATVSVMLMGAFLLYRGLTYPAMGNLPPTGTECHGKS
ncbi:MAG TPA: sulfite exporter TauE/SafE family protein [Paludibaculum sp.]